MEARELQLQQRVWHVEALAEEAAAREVAGHQAEVPNAPKKDSRIFNDRRRSIILFTMGMKHCKSIGPF